MRFVLFTIGLGVGLTLTSCARDPTHQSPGGCATGQESCGNTCVPTGTCHPVSTGGTGGTGTGTGTGSQTPASQNCTDVGSAYSVLRANYSNTVVPVSGVDKQYVAQTNWWNLYNQQTVTVNGLSFTVANPAGAVSPNNNPMGFPSFFIGSYAGNTTKGSKLPKQVSALTHVYTVLSTNAGSKGYNNYNAAYDVWFTQAGTPLSSSQYDPGPGGAFLMVWLFRPGDRQPRGQNRYPSHPVSGLGNWDVWIDNSSDPLCISYVSTSPKETLDYDLNDFIQDAIKNGYGITNNMYLSIIFGGFEIWGGGDGLQVKAFCANVQ